MLIAHAREAATQHHPLSDWHISWGTEDEKERALASRSMVDGRLLAEERDHGGIFNVYPVRVRVYSRGGVQGMKVEFDEVVV